MRKLWLYVSGAAIAVVAFTMGITSSIVTATVSILVLLLLVGLLLYL
jgi:hypothetical protein